MIKDATVDENHLTKDEIYDIYFQVNKVIFFIIRV